METETLFTPDEAARKKGVSRQTIYTAIRRKHIASERRYNRLVVRESELAVWTPATPAERGRRGMAGRMAKAATATNAPGKPTEQAEPAEQAEQAEQAEDGGK